MTSGVQTGARPPAASCRSLVLGLGRTGLSVARYLSRLGHRIVVCDSRDAPPELEQLQARLPATEVVLGRFEIALLDGADQIVVSPGIAAREPILREAERRGMPVIGDIELFTRAAPAPIVAITGTNGKSTVTSLTAAMVEACGRGVYAGGNLGEPALDLLERDPPEFYVLELSSFQLERTESLQAAAAAVLNVTPDHMDRYATLADYAAAKARVYEGCETAVVNRDDPIVAAALPAGRRRLMFGLDPRGDFGLIETGGETWLARDGEGLLPLAELALTGRHNAANALASLALGSALGMPSEPMCRVLTEFRGLPHRTQRVADRGGVTYINDSKGTNVGATVAAIAGFREPLVLIAGGDGKNADFQPLAEAAAGRLRAAVVIGRDAPLLEAVLAPLCPVERAPDMDEAVRRAARLARAGDVVLLSPACSSLDMYRDYTERGRVFELAVGKLGR